MSRVSGRRIFLASALLVALGALAAFCFAQANSSAIVTFGLEFPGSQPERYLVQIPAQGMATYSSDGKLTRDSEKDDAEIHFTISDATRNRIFELAKKAKYFEGLSDSGKKNLAFTGSKTLTYSDDHKNTRLSYNYCQNPSVMALTGLFQNLSTTLEFGRRLNYYHRYQKLALDDELKRMDDMMSKNALDEVSALNPILDQIAKDQTVINPVRARAQRIMERAGSSKP